MTQEQLTQMARQAGFPWAKEPVVLRRLEKFAALIEQALTPGEPVKDRLDFWALFDENQRLRAELKFNTAPQPQPKQEPVAVPEALIKWAYSPELVETGNNWQQGYEHARAWVHVQLSCNNVAPQPQPKPQPVGYWDGEFSEDGGATLYEVPQASVFGRKYPNLPLFTAPQPQRDDTALLRQALEALEAAYGWQATTPMLDDAIAALRERLK